MNVIGGEGEAFGDFLRFFERCIGSHSGSKNDVVSVIRYCTFTVR